MRDSRAPEGRGSHKQILFLLTGVAIAAVAAAVVFLSTGSDSISAENELSTGTLGTEPVGQPEGAPGTVAAPAATATPVPQPAPTPTAAPAISPEASSMPTVYPNAQFGEVLEEGLLDLRYPQGELINTWYTFQVDTETRDITLYFANYNESYDFIHSTIKVDEYTKGAKLGKAEVTLNYPDGSNRTMIFDGKEGTIALNQQYNLPVGPSMFSSGLRRAMVFYGMQLSDDQGDIDVALHLDLSGLSQSEGLEFKRLAPEIVDDALIEIQFMVEQIEDNRMQP